MILMGIEKKCFSEKRRRYNYKNLTVSEIILWKMIFCVYKSTIFEFRQNFSLELIFVF